MPFSVDLLSVVNHSLGHLARMLVVDEVRTGEVLAGESGRQQDERMRAAVPSFLARSRSSTCCLIIFVLYVNHAAVRHEVPRAPVYFLLQPNEELSFHQNLAC